MQVLLFQTQNLNMQFLFLSFSHLCKTNSSLGSSSDSLQARQKTILTMWDFRFSCRRVWRQLSSGVSRCVVWCLTWGSKLLWNVAQCLPDFTTQHTGRQPSSAVSIGLYVGVYINCELILFYCGFNQFWFWSDVYLGLKMSRHFAKIPPSLKLYWILSTETDVYGKLVLGSWLLHCGGLESNASFKFTCILDMLWRIFNL
jgi:hypothetical protein